MTQNSVNAQQQSMQTTNATHAQTTALTFPQNLEHLALLVPEAVQWLPHDLIEFALAFAVRYQGDVLQLELQWDLLMQALIECWRSRNYVAVVRLARVLALPAGRRTRLTEGTYVLRLGLVASRRCQDRGHEAMFLNRLGGLMFAGGRYDAGKRIWQVGLQQALSLGSPLALWQPLVSFASCIDILATPVEAQRFVTLMQAVDNSECLAFALFSRGLYARWTDNLDAACADFSACLGLILQQEIATPQLPIKQLFHLVVQAEFARAQGYYGRSQAYTQAALALAELFSDRYTLVSLLIDQGIFCYQQGRWADLQVVCLQLHTLVHQMEIPHALNCYTFLERRLLASRASTDTTFLLSSPAPKPPDTLSVRECEVLRLVAAGHTNEEIAAQLVITRGTVKKHLEHIYTHLDVHSRTAAVARARESQII